MQPSFPGCCAVQALGSLCLNLHKTSVNTMGVACWICLSAEVRYAVECSAFLYSVIVLQAEAFVFARLSLPLQAYRATFVCISMSRRRSFVLRSLRTLSTAWQTRSTFGSKSGIGLWSIFSEVRLTFFANSLLCYCLVVVLAVGLFRFRPRMLRDGDFLRTLVVFGIASFLALLIHLCYFWVD